MENTTSMESKKAVAEHRSSNEPKSGDSVPCIGRGASTSNAKNNLSTCIVTQVDVSHLEKALDLITFDSEDEYIPHVSGLDTLYYFAQSNGSYDSFYEELVNQIEDKKAYFKSINYNYDDNDIIVKINDIDIVYSGMGRDGFHWFRHDFFRAGFKDSEKSPNINNIRIQLNAIGIYTLGIKSLVDYINTLFLKGITTGYFPVTRIDVNMFIQHDFKYLRKEMVVSKKKNHSANISERSSGYELETYYIGSKPFLMRIYNKRKELQGALDVKRDLMNNYFGVHGLDIEKPIFNVEIELHRVFLQDYGIDTIDDALQSAERLFKHGCELIRLIDIEPLTEAQINSSNRKRAKTLPVWQFIKDNYSVKEFMQIETPLEKVEKISYRYSMEDARKPINRIITRLLLHDNAPTSLYFSELLEFAKEQFELRQHMKSLHKEHKEEEKHHKRSPYEKFVEELTMVSDNGLPNYKSNLTKEMNGVIPSSELYHELQMKYLAVDEEIKKRNEDYYPF